MSTNGLLAGQDFAGISYSRSRRVLRHTDIIVAATFVLIVIGLCGRPAYAASADSAKVTSRRPLVVVNYFAGWWKELPNKWHGRGWNDQEPDWRPDYPDRVPILGQYNEQATMDREIAAAAEHGVDAFAILWYFPKPGSRREQYAPLLNKGISGRRPGDAGRSKSEDRAAKSGEFLTCSAEATKLNPLSVRQFSNRGVCGA